MITHEGQRDEKATYRPFVTMEQDNFLGKLFLYAQILEKAVEALQLAASGKLVTMGSSDGLFMYAVTDPERALVIRMPDALCAFYDFRLDERLANDLGEKFPVKHDRATNTLVVTLLQDK